jgi:hypothetical protein
MGVSKDAATARPPRFYGCPQPCKGTVWSMFGRCDQVTRMLAAGARIISLKGSRFDVGVANRDEPTSLYGD